MDTRRTITTSILVFSLLAAPLALADDGSIQAVINGKSIHLDSDYDWNENNIGLGIEYEFEPKSRWVRTFLANGFKDSNENMSFMAGAGLHRRLLQSDRFDSLYIDAGITAFVMTRDDIEGGAPFLGALPSITVGNRHVGINLSYVPKSIVHDFANANRVDPNIDGLVFLQFKFRLDRWLSD